LINQSEKFWTTDNRHLKTTAEEHENDVAAVNIDRHTYRVTTQQQNVSEIVSVSTC